MYSADVIVDGRMSNIHRCKDCHMTFNAPHLLSKHKQKFCVGSTGDPDDLQLRRGFRSTSPRVIVSPDRDDYRRSTNQDLQLRNLAENHGRQMEYLNLRNRDLEKQREDIRKQLENLGRKTVVPPQDNTAELLRELREQEMRNQRALDDLRRQLQDLHGNQKVNVIEIEKPVYHQPPPPPPQPQPEPPKRSLVFPVYYGKSLVAEISAIRQAYLQNGGNDPDVLSQMSQMQAEAQAIEDQMNQKPEHKSPREKPKDNDATFRMLEMENDRLNQQLRLLQEQNLLAQNRNKSDKEGKEVHLHISVPKSAFGKRQHKKRKIKKSSLPKEIISEQHTVGIIQPVQTVQPYNYAPQLPCFTVFNFPQEQPAVYSFPQPQIQQTTGTYSTAQPQLQQITGTYSTTQPKQYISYNIPKRETDARSYHSEPNRRSGEKIVRYTASHQPDGTVHIVRSNSFEHAGFRHKPHVPPLDLRDLVTPTGQKNKKGNKGYGENEKESSFGKPGKYKTRPFTTKLSHVSEGAEQGVRSQMDGPADVLPPDDVQEQGSGSGSKGRPLSGVKDVTGNDIDQRPKSNQTLGSQNSGNLDRDIYSPGGDEGTGDIDEPQDVAWQVRRSSPPKYNTYDYQY